MPHDPKVSQMVTIWDIVLSITIWNGIELDQNVSKCIFFNHIFPNFLRGKVPTPAILDNQGWTKVLGKRGHKHSDVTLKLQQLGIFVQYF